MLLKNPSPLSSHGQHFPGLHGGERGPEVLRVKEEIAAGDDGRLGRRAEPVWGDGGGPAVVWGIPGLTWIGGAPVH